MELDLELSDQAMERIEIMKDRTKQGSTSALIRDALRLYDYVLEQRVEGWKVHLVNGEKAKELLLPPETSEGPDPESFH